MTLKSFFIKSLKTKVYTDFTGLALRQFVCVAVCNLVVAACVLTSFIAMLTTATTTTEYGFIAWNIFGGLRYEKHENMNVLWLAVYGPYAFILVIAEFICVNVVKRVANIKH